MDTETYSEVAVAGNEGKSEIEEAEKEEKNEKEEDHETGSLSFIDIRRMRKNGEIIEDKDATHKIPIYPLRGKDVTRSALLQLYATVMRIKKILKED
jgi:hypothetical protein